MAFPAKSGFHEMPQESGRPLGPAKRRALDHSIEGREHRIMRDFTACLRLRLFIEIWLRGQSRLSPLCLAYALFPRAATHSRCYTLSQVLLP